MQTLSIDDAGLLARAEALRAEGQTVVFVAIDGRPAGLLGIADPIKPSTREAIELLHGAGLRVVMLTGDSRATAEAVARQLDIDEVHAEVLPQDKSAEVARLKAAAHNVAMAGDGVNDAPALAQADVGIAMGTGADVAIESADITLVSGDLRGVVRARHLSQATHAQHSPEPVFRIRLQLRRRTDRGGDSVPRFRAVIEPHDRQRGHDVQFSLRSIANALRLREAKL